MLERIGVGKFPGSVNLVAISIRQVTVLEDCGGNTCLVCYGERVQWACPSHYQINDIYKMSHVGCTGVVSEISAVPTLVSSKEPPLPFYLENIFSLEFLKNLSRTE